MTCFALGIISVTKKDEEIEEERPAKREEALKNH
jgi:hypothetical protein